MRSQPKTSTREFYSQLLDRFLEVAAFESQIEIAEAPFHQLSVRAFLPGPHGADSISSERCPGPDPGMARLAPGGVTLEMSPQTARSAFRILAGCESKRTSREVRRNADEIR